MEAPQLENLHFYKQDTQMRPAIVDVEASGFSPDSYPIEIGVILPNGAKYCTLIKPVSYWSHWDESAEKLHGISRDVIEKHGKQVTEIALDLNEMLYDQIIYTDGWVVDKPWIDQIFMTAKTPRRFHISALEMILTEDQMESWATTKSEVLDDLDVVRHRASSDAMVVQETFFRTFQK